MAHEDEGSTLEVVEQKGGNCLGSLLVYQPLDSCEKETKFYS